MVYHLGAFSMVNIMYKNLCENLEAVSLCQSRIFDCSTAERGINVYGAGFFMRRGEDGVNEVHRHVLLEACQSVCVLRF